MLPDPHLIILIGGEKIRQYTIADKIWLTIRDHFCANFTHEIIPVTSQAMLQEVVRACMDNPAFRGGNVALPWKDAMLGLCTDHDSFTQEVGIVSAFAKSGQALKSFNMDVVAIDTALMYEDIATSGRTVLILGAGGAGRSLAYYLAGKGVDTIITDSNDDALHAVRAMPGIRTRRRVDLAALLQSCDVVVNATTVGNTAYWGGDRYVFSSPLSLVEVQALPRHAVGIEMNYRPYLTHFLDVLQLTGRKVVPGVDMLILQALYTLREAEGVSFTRQDFATIKAMVIARVPEVALSPQS